MEVKGELEIVKIKNRFHTALGDAMLFLRYENRF